MHRRVAFKDERLITTTHTPHREKRDTREPPRENHPNPHTPPKPQLHPMCFGDNTQCKVLPPLLHLHVICAGLVWSGGKKDPV